ncbi:hypothetical protein [Ruminococcus flavefaciens]|uniref:hypothetical protein n=1 Tax=Ruminococcus flavefaciens TaxID=1265 RepID=UPI0026F0DE5E|nr:hypothetical protein [Ruminococcus flavefaciens]
MLQHHLTEQGELNGDMNGDGLTLGDAQAIQLMLLGCDNNNSNTIAGALISDQIYVKKTAAYNQAVVRRLFVFYLCFVYTDQL